MTPRLSVVVPTRDRPEPLARCLDALRAQDEPVTVIVVDDGSADAGIVADVARGADTTLLRADGNGPAAARNRGARATVTRFVAFTDDDCAPDPGWAASLLARLDPTADGAADTDTDGTVPAAVVAGPTENGRPEDPWAAASQLITNHVVGHGFDAEAGTVDFAPTSNLAMTRSVHVAVPFDETFPLAAGEDRDHCARLADAGYAITWEPAARVRHFQDLGRDGFWRQQERYGQGAAAFRDRPGAGRDYPDVGFFTTLARDAWRAGPGVAARVAAAQVATVAGLLRA